MNKNYIIFEEKGLFGLRGDTGDVLIEPQYKEMQPFSCGLSQVRNERFQYAYINAENRQVVPFGRYVWIDPAIMSLGNNNINTYVEADLDYANAKKVQASVNTATLFGFIQLERNGNKTLKSANRYKGLSKREAQALYRAKENADVDIILEPEFETEKHSWFFGAYRTSSTKVKGWGVNIKGIQKDQHGIPNR